MELHDRGVLGNAPSDGSDAPAPAAADDYGPRLQRRSSISSARFQPPDGAAPGGRGRVPPGAQLGRISLRTPLLAAANGALIKLCLRIWHAVCSRAGTPSACGACVASALLNRFLSQHRPGACRPRRGGGGGRRGAPGASPRLVGAHWRPQAQRREAWGQKQVLQDEETWGAWAQALNATAWMLATLIRWCERVWWAVAGAGARGVALALRPPAAARLLGRGAAGGGLPPHRCVPPPPLLRMQPKPFGTAQASRRWRHCLPACWLVAGPLPPSR